MKMLSRIASIVPVVFVCSSCATSHVIMVGQARPAIGADLVRIYNMPPRNFDRIAIINSSSGGSWAFTERAQVDEAIAKIREQSAKLAPTAFFYKQSGRDPAAVLALTLAASVSEVEDITLTQSVT